MSYEAPTSATITGPAVDCAGAFAQSSSGQPLASRGAVSCLATNGRERVGFASITDALKTRRKDSRGTEEARG
jgi:hypothetical protein